MDNVRKRLNQDLKIAWSRLRQLGVVVAIEEGTDTIGGNTAFADEVDAIQANAGREIGLATRERVMERVGRLTAALERFAAGTYGVCSECGEAISPARLRALPEAEACVRCQDGFERLGRAGDPNRQSLFDDGAEHDVVSAGSRGATRAWSLPNEEDRDAGR